MYDKTRLHIWHCMLVSHVFVCVCMHRNAKCSQYVCRIERTHNMFREHGGHNPIGRPNCCALSSARPCVLQTNSRQPYRHTQTHINSVCIACSLPGFVMLLCCARSGHDIDISNSTPFIVALPFCLSLSLSLSIFLSLSLSIYVCFDLSICRSVVCVTSLLFTILHRQFLTGKTESVK